MLITNIYIFVNDGRETRFEKFASFTILVKYPLNQFKLGNDTEDNMNASSYT